MALATASISAFPVPDKRWLHRTLMGCDSVPHGWCKTGGRVSCPAHCKCFAISAFGQTETAKESSVPVSVALMSATSEEWRFY